MKVIELPLNCVTNLIASETARKLSLEYPDKFIVFENKSKSGLGFKVDCLISSDSKAKLGEIVIETWYKGTKI
jgi:hypothetical protein